MPTLIAAVFNIDQKPIVWKCSACEEAFTHDRMREARSSELLKINDDFDTHCRQKHAGESVIGIVVPG